MTHARHDRISFAIVASVALPCTAHTRDRSMALRNAGHHYRSVGSPIVPRGMDRGLRRCDEIFCASPRFFLVEQFKAKRPMQTMAKDMRFMRAWGGNVPCGGDFLAKPFLAAHPEFAWEEPYLRDMKAGPWTEFRSGQSPKE